MNGLAKWIVGSVLVVIAACAVLVLGTAIWADAIRNPGTTEASIKLPKLPVIDGIRADTGSSCSLDFDFVAQNSQGGAKEEWHSFNSNFVWFKGGPTTFTWKGIGSTWVSSNDDGSNMMKLTEKDKGIPNVRTAWFSCDSNAGSFPTPFPGTTPQPQPQPQPSPTPAQPSGQRGACMTMDAFKALANGISDPYKLIDVLDNRLEKVDHPQGGFTLTPGTYVLWTGLYVQDTSIGKTTTPFLVDGKTGTWIVNATQSVVIPTPGGTICISGAPSNTNQPSTAACVAKNLVVDAINNNKTSDPNGIYRRLDELADQNVSARIRSSNTPFTVQAKNSRTFLWVRSGNISNGNALVLDMTEGKALYMATKDADVQVNFPFAGIVTCDPVNPAADFPWWGK